MGHCKACYRPDELFLPPGPSNQGGRTGYKKGNWGAMQPTLSDIADLNYLPGIDMQWHSKSIHAGNGHEDHRTETRLPSYQLDAFPFRGPINNSLVAAITVTYWGLPTYLRS
ncbi:hypothetical protein VTK26DRAFT_2321 [Humicola hyalothermophila]